MPMKTSIFIFCSNVLGSKISSNSLSVNSAKNVLIPSNLIRQYADYVLINMSPYDITLDFCDIVFITKQDIEIGSIKRPLKYRITLPIAVAQNLLDMLTDALKARKEFDEKNEEDTT